MDCVIRIWACLSGQLLAQLTGHSGPIRCLSIHPSGEMLSSGRFFGVIFIMFLILYIYL